MLTSLPTVPQIEQECGLRIEQVNPIFVQADLDAVVQRLLNARAAFVEQRLREASTPHVWPPSYAMLQQRYPDDLQADWDAILAGLQAVAGDAVKRFVVSDIRGMVPTEFARQWSMEAKAEADLQLDAAIKQITDIVQAQGSLEPDVPQRLVPRDVPTTAQWSAS